MPGGGVAIIGSPRIFPAGVSFISATAPEIGTGSPTLYPAAPWLKSSRPSELEFWPNEFDSRFGASMEWTDKSGRSWNYTYRLWDSYFDAANDASFASAGGIDAVSGLGGGEFYNWILRATLVDKSPA